MEPNNNSDTKNMPAYSNGEEIANSITHIIGVGLAIAALVIAIVYACMYRSGAVVTACSIYGAAMILLFAFSSLYHAVRGPRLKKIFQKCDHIGIYVLIAGTYTPILLGPLSGPWGWSIFGVVWFLAVAGAAGELLLDDHREKFAVWLSLLMGWLALIVVKPLFEALTAADITLLVTGGVCYSLGVIFYRWESLKFSHAIWHIFVLAGCICQFFAILGTIIP